MGDFDSLGGGAELTSAKVGGYVLQLVYLLDSLPPGEVKDQHPVAWGDVLQPGPAETKIANQSGKQDNTVLHTFIVKWTSNVEKKTTTKKNWI